MEGKSTTDHHPRDHFGSIDACYVTTINHNLLLYELRILALKDAVSRGEKSFDRAKVIAQLPENPDSATFDGSKACDVIAREIDRLEDANHVKRMLERYESISTCLYRAEARMRIPMSF